MIKRASIFSVAGLLVMAGAAFAQNSTVYSYDALGRVVSVQEGEGYKTTYDFDQTGNRSNVTSVSQFDNYWLAQSLSHIVGFSDGDGWAVNIYEPSHFMIYGPYTTAVPTGDRVATFRMLIDNNTYNSANIVALDVYDATASEYLHSPKTIKRTDWNTANNYEVFELPFNMSSARAGHQLEFRVYFIGGAYVRVNKVGYY